MNDSKACWIWYNSDFEIYHNMLLSCRRQELVCDMPCAWRTSRPEVNVDFYKEAFAEEDGIIRVVTRSKGNVGVDGRRYPVNTDIKVKKGRNEIVVSLYDVEGFPSFFLDGCGIKSDSSWTAHCGDRVWKAVGFEPMFTSPDDNPCVFPFNYSPLTPVTSENVNGGILYDFGKETFGRVTLSGYATDSRIVLAYGESKEEALDTEEHVTIREVLQGEFSPVRPSRAFRYIFVKNENGSLPDISAEYEFLPLEDIASFKCSDKESEMIWDVCSYTFHLNSREFFLDGIKRDRWVWSGDAYQSFMINRYLYNDPAITKRTIRALLGSGNYTSHINTINDYSAYIIFSVWEYYCATSDKAFVISVWDKVERLYAFVCSRLDDRGYVVKKPNDWIFIDWGDVDKDGTLCAEQILLMHLHRVMGKLCKLMGKKSDGEEKALLLADQIKNDYWRQDKNAFVDCFDNGKEHISKQTNIFAVLFELVDKKTALDIKEYVLDNEKLTPVTTPYFKFYELIARCQCSGIKETVDFMKSYWGGMLKLGATTVWEQYDPSKTGIDHYAMYGRKYGKSLCHAWGSGPIYLIGRFVAGVSMADDGINSFTVKPATDIYESFEAIVPIYKGKVTVKCFDRFVSVLTTVDGGKLVLNGKEYKLTANEELIVRNSGVNYDF